MNAALRQARESCASVATIPTETLSRPLIVYRIRDKVTGEQRTVRSVILGVEVANDSTGADTVLKDWELLEKLNGLVGARGFRGKNSLPPAETAPVERALDRGVVLMGSKRDPSSACLFVSRRRRQLPSCGPLHQVLRNKGRKTKEATSMTVRFELVSLGRSVGQANRDARP